MRPTLSETIDGAAKTSHPEIVIEIALMVPRFAPVDEIHHKLLCGSSQFSRLRPKLDGNENKEDAGDEEALNRFCHFLHRESRRCTSLEYVLGI